MPYGKIALAIALFLMSASFLAFVYPSRTCLSLPSGKIATPVFCLVLSVSQRRRPKSIASNLSPDLTLFNGAIRNGAGQNISTLMELGLTISQAKIYLSLARSGNLTANEASKVAKIARPDVYRVFSELEAAGLVERIILNPARFRAVPVDVCVSILLQRRIRKTADLEQKAHGLVLNVSRETTTEESRQKFQLLLLPSKENVYAKAENMLKNARKSICCLASTRRMLSWLEVSYNSVEEALSRKVDFKVIMPKPDGNQEVWKAIENLTRHSTFNSRFITGSPDTAFSVWDGKEVLIATSTLDSPIPVPTLWSNDAPLVSLAMGYFDYLWTDAKKVKIGLA